jgi:hypothetical protein
VGDEDGVLVEILVHDVPGASSEPEAATLADGVKPRTPVVTEDLSARDVADLAGTLSEMVTNEIVERNATEETDSLAVGPIGILEPETSSALTDLGLGHIADREKTPRELMLTKLAEEVGLVLLRIGAAEKVESTIAVLDLHVVARSDTIESFPDPIDKRAELDHAVAHHIGARRASGLEF